MVGKRPARFVTSKSLSSTTVMRIVLILVSGVGGISEVTGRSGVGSYRRVDRTFFGQALCGLLLSQRFLEGALILALM